MKNSKNQNRRSYTDLVSTNAVKSRRLSLLWLMLFTLMLLPARMVAQNRTPDPRCDLFNNLNGISNVTITDNTSYPWQLLNLKADGMDHLGFTIPEGSTGLMSGNYHKGNSTSYTEVNFKVEKPLLLTFKFLVSSDYYDKATITIDNKKFEGISGIKQIEIKESLSAGKHTLKLSYQKDYSGNNNADRTFIYDLKTATSISDNKYIAEYNAKNTTLTFKKVIDANISDIGNNSVIVEKYNNVGDICNALGNVTIKNIVFEESFKTYAPTSLKEFFYNCKTLEKISGLEYLNTTNITDMSSMFRGCSNLKSLDFTNFDTKNVSNMYFMFYGCSTLNSLDLTNFNTKNVSNMNGMFGDCSNLISLNITNFNTAKVTNMGNMFLGCSNLTSLDLTNFNTAKVTDMHGMFKACSALTSLDLTNFNTAEVRDMNRMFYMLDESSTALTTIYVSDNFVTANVTNGENMFKNCTKLKGSKKYFLLDTDHTYANYTTGYFTSGCGYAEFDDATGTLTFRYKGVKPKGAYKLEVEAYRHQWIDLGTKVKKVVFNASFAGARPTVCYAWFYNNSNLTTIEGLEYLNTEDVTNMEYMFDGCSALESLDLSKFNTAKVTSMKKMFNNCSALKSLNLSGFNTANVTSMKQMFNKCSALKSLNLSGFNTAKVTDMDRLFAGCSALESLDLSMFNTSSVESMPDMFNGAKKLKTINVSSFNTEKVKNMGHMFTDCSDLTSLDLSSFNTKVVEYVDYMFQNCSNLTTIYVSANFAFGSGLKNGSEMFNNCTNLKGFIEYKNNTDKDNNEFANYKTGYFTKLVGKNGDEKIGAVGETLTAESLALDDEKDFVAYEPFAAKAATYNRTMNEGTTWATLCLPFEVSLENQNFRAFKLLSANEATNTVELEEITTSITAGTPVIIKMKEGQTALDISEADKDIAQKVVSAADGNYQLQGLYTKKVFDKVADNNCYIVKGDKLMNPAKLLVNTNNKAVGSMPFRAYMVDNSAPTAGAKMYSISFDDNSTTAIDRLNTVADDNAIYYDLQGKRLNGPQKGINIVKRGSKTMKVIIK